LIEQFLELEGKGWTASRIADVLGVSTRTVYRLRRKHGFARTEPATHYPVTGERLAAASRMISEGVSHCEIARTLGMQTATLRRHFPGTGWSHEVTNDYINSVRRANRLIERMYA
jgi:DNA-binding NarL/FixJ family response regulator